MNIQSLLIKASATIKQALEQLELTGQGILLLVDSKLKLSSTVTDGDLRRLLLSGAGMDACLNEFPMQSPKYIHTSDDVVKAFELMDAFALDQVPVVDANQVPCRLIHRRELKHPILLSTPHLGNLEEHFIQEALRTNWVAPLGPNVDAFENEMAQYLNVPYAAALSSGTAAIHMALRLLDVNAEDEIFCSALTFVASANPILYQGAKPTFIDSEEKSWNMSPAALQRAFADAVKKKRLPKAVIIVNLYGQSADMDALLEICNHYEVPVIEDAAESLGATYHNQASGTFGSLGVFSFNGNKIITTSGGGLLVSSNETFIQKARFLATQARDCAPHYQHSELGYNYRMSNVLAGIGRGQLHVLKDRIQARRSVFERYQGALADISGIEWMPEADFGFSTRWLTAMRINPNKTSLTPASFIQQLAEQQIEARPVWKPLQRQPLFQSCKYYPHEPENSVSDRLFQEGVCLPSGSNLSFSSQMRVIEAIREIFLATVQTNK
jgi:dTDP-4-amino-4,6-dideoxygalactose transaminase